MKAIAGSPAARAGCASALLCVSGLRRDAARHRRGRLGNTWARTCALQGCAPCTSEVKLRALPTYRAGSRAVATDRARSGRSWFAGSYPGIEVCGSPAVVPAVTDLRPARGQARALDVGRLGR